MKYTVTDSLLGIDKSAWDALNVEQSPFLSHAFLAALEQHGCVGEALGWMPQFLLAQDDAGELRGAVPLYVKTNSYGELVFDWAWADAYARHGLRYYPKAVVAVPYTPANGARVLLHPDADQSLLPALMQGADQWVRDHRLSSLHWLFVHDAQRQAFRAAGLFERNDCQFHWRNRGYADFDAFLATLSSKKRKNIRRERRLVAESGVTVEAWTGDRINDALWSIVYRFYRSTFDRKGGLATLTEGFFRAIGRSMGEQILVFLARRDDQYLAASILFFNDQALWGRHWGVEPELANAIDGLHFELCYYRGIEFCIEHGLQRFEPGAQGEFKHSRGFEPTETCSFHMLVDARFQQAIGQFVEHEAEAVRAYIDDLGEHSPYKCR